MKQFLLQRPGLDMTLLGGWLFADLLLGLMVIFLAAVPPVPKPPTPAPPILTVSPLVLSPGDGNCSSNTIQPVCTVTIGETNSSQGTLQWIANSDMSDTVQFSSTHRTLVPGATTKVTISAFPCQNGSFTFAGANGVVPVTVRWRCTPHTERLQTTYNSFTLNVSSVEGLLHNDENVTNNIVQQIKQENVLQGESVGLTIVYGDALNDDGIQQAQQISQKVYDIIKQVGKSGFVFQRSSYYKQLYNFFPNDPSDAIDQNVADTVQVDVYFFA